MLNLIINVPLPPRARRLRNFLPPYYIRKRENADLQATYKEPEAHKRNG